MNWQDDCNMPSIGGHGGAAPGHVRVFSVVHGSPHPACGHLLTGAEKGFIL